MANTADTLEKDGTIQVSYTASGADWDYITDTPAYAKLGYLCTAITLHGKDTDVFVINEDSNDGPSIVHWQLGADTDDRVRLFRPAKWIKPYIELTDQTYATITSVKITFTLE